MIRLLSKRENLQFSITAFLILLLAILSLFVMQTDIPTILWERTGPLVFPMIFLGSIFFGNVAEAVYLKCFKKELNLDDIRRVAGAILNAGSLLAHAGFLGTVWGIMLSMSALGENGSVDPPKVLSALALAVTTTLVGSGIDHVGRLFVIYVLGESIDAED
ncbi:MotA/TolQ/ExbB proton channel family protein [Desulfobacterota bacterium AH_259_B03_O07]|nr:MotA/TolQ/ExbB proton channel family protein [Desulfobacterota bacterium AH_259_B03_O07]